MNSPMRRNVRRRRRKKKQPHDLTSNHYNRSRIEKELDLFYGHDNNNDENQKPVPNRMTTMEMEGQGQGQDQGPSSSPKFMPKSKSPIGNNRNNRHNRHNRHNRKTHSHSHSHLLPLSSLGKIFRKSSAISSSFQDMDPVFDLDPTPGRCDTDDFNFLSIMEEDQEEKGQGIRPSKAYPESDIDGFSIVDQMPIPERKMIMDYSPNHQLASNKPPELLTISMDMDSIMGTPSEKTTASSSSKNSRLSYDEGSTHITSSVAFFLNANKEDLQNEGLSIAGGTTKSRYGNDTNTATSSNISPKATRSNNSNNLNCVSRSSSHMSVDMSEEESQSATAKDWGYSRGSSKFTTDSPRILELRERKRLMERSHERLYRPRAFPALIEVDKFS